MIPRNYFLLRIISVVMLYFFTWTFGGLFDIAYAVTNNKQAIVSSKQQKEPKTEEKFQKTLDEIEQIIIDPSTDVTTKKSKLKIKKSEIEAYDTEIKKQFADTEKKLKNEGLPYEILERHYNFVKDYEKNLNELKNNLDAIEKGKDKKDIEAKIEETKKFLQKVKPPKKHAPLDPNKLPHRTPEEKQTILEEWKAPEKPIPPPGFLKKSDIQNEKPVLIAANGSLQGLLPPDTQIIAENYVQVAEATPVKHLAPSQSDLAETIEIQFTSAIRAKAAELGNHPVKMYEWVRNNIDYVPTYGSIQGADMCLQTKQCNDIDTASLVIALFRVSGIHARYAYGTIERPIEKVMNWMGGFTDPMSALRLIASAGIPVKGMTVGGQVKYVQMEHVWVEAYIDYIPSRGAKHRTGQGDTWIPLDASYKQFTYTQGVDIKTAVPFDVQSFIDQIKNTATINETEGYATNVNSLYIQQHMQAYQTQVQNYISQNYPNATVGDIIGKKEIVKEEFPYLLGTLHRRVIAKTWEQPDLPDNLRHKITFNVTKDIYDSELGTPINITKSLPELAGKKITLSYGPATAQDEAVINSYLPKPHADGTPIDPSELPSSLPAYLIKLKPELRIDGVVAATGTSVVMGNTETFTMTFTAPKTSPDVITNQIEAGEYLGIGLDLGRISQEQMTALRTKLEATKAKLEAQEFSGISRDDILGTFLYATALSYHTELKIINYLTAKTMGVAAINLPSETIFSFELKRNFVFGIPISVSSGGLAMDADRLLSLVKALDGDTNKPKQFFLNSGMNSSVLEHSVPEQLFSTPENPARGISAIKALQIANGHGIPIYTINQTNINTILPQLQVDTDVKADIQNAVNAGKEVTVSKTDITFNGWTGCGYIIVDPTTGAGAYMISGGMNGAAITLILTAFLLLAVAIAIGPVALVVVSLLLPIYLSFQGWLASQTNREKADAFFECIGLHIIYHVALEGNMPIIIELAGKTAAKVISILAIALFGLELGECIAEVFIE